MNKRVHEIAKERGVPSRAVLERLRAAGVEVKAASSSVDEALALRVLDGGAQDGGRDGASEAATAEPAKLADDRVQKEAPPQQAAAPAQQSSEAVAPQAAAPAARPQPKRPTRDSLQGERAPGSAGGRRRVVIDSQASRRATGGAPPPTNQPP